MEAVMQRSYWKSHPAPDPEMARGDFRQWAQDVILDMFEAHADRPIVKKVVVDEVFEQVSFRSTTRSGLGAAFRRDVKRDIAFRFGSVARWFGDAWADGGEAGYLTIPANNGLDCAYLRRRGACTQVELEVKLRAETTAARVHQEHIRILRDWIAVLRSDSHAAKRALAAA